MATQSGIPIRRLTLYKHGVAFVERRGSFTGDEIPLTVRADALNDTLKSLLAHDHHGGQILGMRYDAPGDATLRRDDSFITLSDDHSLLDLLRGLRGWAVRLVTGDGTHSQDITGRVLGVDLATPHTPASQTVVALVDDASGTVRAVPLNELRQVVVLDERAAQDLRLCLDTSRRDDAQRTITLRLSPGEHDLAISYLVPSPTWRVSYRLIAEPASASTGAAAETGARDGLLLLQGWGLFDNHLDEDLDEVAVTLVAGQPISFLYDLATSRIPQRPLMEDEARVAAGPVEFAGALPPAPMALAASRGPRRKAANGDSMDAPALMQAMSAYTIEQMATQTVAASGAEASELFEYRVTVPVTVKRGGSALAPIVSVQLPYRRELLFNERKLAGHPVAALRFGNASGLVLERGPAVVQMDGAYHGEAMLPFTKTGAEVYLAYAVELGLTVTTSSNTTRETVGLRIAGALLELKQATVLHTTYRLENTLDTAQAVTIEHPIWANATLTETPAPQARTAEVYRWTITCAPRSATAFAVAERLDTWQATHLLDQSYAELEKYLRLKWLDDTTLARIEALVREKAAIARNEQEMNRLVDERTEIYGREEQLRQNMAALNTTGDEGVLRAQVVGQLRTAEERLSAIHLRLSALQEENRTRQTSIETQLASFTVTDPPADA